MSDFGLEISPRIMGRVVEPLRHEFIRELRVSDLELLNAPRPNNGATPLKRLGDRHRALARNIAKGARPGEAAAILGYQVAYVNVLLANPAFKELVSVYASEFQGEQNAMMRTNFERLSGLNADAADELTSRLENEPEKISTNQLLEIIKVAADRSGNGPQTSNVQVNINANIADRMKIAREQARIASEPKRDDLGVMIEATPNKAAL